MNTNDKNRKPGWYWVLTSMNHRKPFKKWVLLEWFYEPFHEELEEDSHLWLHGEQDELFMSKILDVVETPIPEPESPYSKESKMETAKLATFTLSIKDDDFSSMDLLVFSRIMENMSNIIGPKAKLVEHTGQQMVFEESEPKSWRNLFHEETVRSDTRPSSKFLGEDEDLLETDELIEVLWFKLDPKTKYDGTVVGKTFDNWSRDSILQFLSLVEKESETK